MVLKNFRCFTDETIEFDDYTALVGANNAGKSAVIIGNECGRASTNFIQACRIRILEGYGI
jgi:predicted ATP-binding protein involved in virulence